ncbi:double-strand break repair protein, putative [Eimeria mitis]|uniref:Double-strand break repair protein, putative n=1 Tax=Eimeria mitis TaxID=44415 RepID=U6K030_9EIME|nr:double-strand break repair protein, putative [Eimeria mitis]CDJ31095.1 double-strand break repair protein, putative [Eimeria mitis]
MGWVRDERLHRAYLSGKVVYEVPADEPTAGWFNILMVHQNMYKGAQGGVAAKNCLLERMLPPFVDLVVWL